MRPAADLAAKLLAQQATKPVAFHPAAPWRALSTSPALTAEGKGGKGGKESPKGPPLLVSSRGGVTTLTMNRPKQLNGWTQEMMEAVRDAFRECAKDPETKVAVLTGTDPYYCAGVQLAASIRPMAPRYRRVDKGDL